MIELELLCSGRASEPLLSCRNAAEVRVANGSHWQRPICLECALELEARGQVDGFPVAFVELEAR